MGVGGGVRVISEIITADIQTPNNTESGQSAVRINQGIKWSLINHFGGNPRNFKILTTSVDKIRSLATAGSEDSYNCISDSSIVSHAISDYSQFRSSSLVREINNHRRESSPFVILSPVNDLCRRANEHNTL